MEKTIIYVVTGGSLMNFGGTELMLYFYLEKDLAEYKAWKLNNCSRHNGPYGNMYSVREIKAGEQVIKDKDYDKFIKEKKAEIQNQIANKISCKEKDEDEIEKLSERLNSFS